MSPVERAFVICQNRNAILSTLLAVYPGSLQGEVLFRSMLGAWPTYTRLFAARDLSYLEDKGYALRKHRLSGRPTTSETPWSEALWQLTARGNEVANQLTHDPALEV